MAEHGSSTREFDVALVLSGGNALGAYQAGALQALHEHGIEPDWVAGASIGAINGALLCGNRPEQRLARLEAFWTPRPEAASNGPLFPGEEARRTAAASWTLAAGRQDLFVPRNLFGPFWNPFANPEPASLYDATPVVGTLERLIDFELLNRGTPRFSATAVDVETGEDVVFDTRSHRIEPDHLRASSALLPVFSPVDVGGRLIGDAGISANLPLDHVLSGAGERPLLCIAIDLLPLRAPRPRSFGETASRTQDLIFATQSRRAIAAWQAIFEARTRTGASASVTLLHVAYADQGREVSGKAFDFSPESVAERWRIGHRDLASALAGVTAGTVPVGSPGLHVFGQEEGTSLAKIEWPLAPVAV
jgi:NTE family protein